MNSLHVHATHIIYYGRGNLSNTHCLSHCRVCIIHSMLTAVSKVTFTSKVFLQKSLWIQQLSSGMLSTDTLAVMCKNLSLNISTNSPSLVSKAPHLCSKNKNGGGLGRKLQFSNLFYMAWLSWKQAWVGYKIDWGIGVVGCFLKFSRNMQQNWKVYTILFSLVK